MAKNVTRMPNRSPKVVSRIYRAGEDQFVPDSDGQTSRRSMGRPANANVSGATREAAIRAKYPANKGWKVNSGKAAYGPKPASTASKIAAGAGRVAGAVVRGAGRIAGGPAGALVSMTQPAGEGSDKPSGPLMSGARERGKGPSSSLSAPSRTAPSRSGSSRGPTSGPSQSSGPSRGPTSAPSRTAPSKPSAPSKSSGPSKGPTSAPSRSQPSKANLGTSRFAEGGMVMKSKRKSDVSGIKVGQSTVAAVQTKGWGKARRGL